MAELRYRAYISYSHKDEAWAAWLHRALESYHVPRNLVGKKARAGNVPARIRPVFRDRDDLSSATDLEITVKQALADSENLIVVCSPDAAASHWVKEEIRYFARLGRVDRIFCIIVGGEPAADGSVSACFSSALAEIGLQEPLAADGIRLDELRQRDLQRRRKRQAVISLGIMAALTLAVMTVVSQISEKHEREKAEQLATFIVDLGERLKSDADLETLALISAEASRHLQGLDPDKLSPETGKKVALAIRQVAQVSQFQGKPDEALEGFQRSRDLLSRLNNKYPEMYDLLFELGNAEYYIGNLYYEQGRHGKALESMQSYYLLTHSLLDTDPDNPDWIMETAQAHGNLAALQLGGGKGINQETLAHMAEAIKLKESVMALRPDDKAVADSFSTSLAWAADAQYQACNLKEAMALRVRASELAEVSMRSDPGDNDLKESYAYTLTGVARISIALGRLDQVEKDLELAISILQQLSAADPSKLVYREEALYRRVMLAKLLGDTGQIESAKSLIMELESKFEFSGAYTNQSVKNQKEHIEFLLVYADVESQLGNVESAKGHLQTVIQLQSSGSDSQTADMFDTQKLVKARYQWWLLNGKDNFDGFPLIPEFAQASANEFRSCLEADSAARMYVIEDDKDSAASEVSYLRTRGYAEPNFIRFCQKHDLCEL